ncbi:PAS domain S-box protein [Ramlibacter terrae]|uniref:PAS domain S-box protein n=1 Tax=Ramlibacter terrae TaxID=2732511 RepID=A0ABX6P5F9_9BURK|nr:PAS domain S-box protein [Ramlibacter terrae]
MVPAMVWLKDRDGRILQLNHRAASMSGLSVEEARGRLVSELFPEEAAMYAAEDREIFATGKPLPSIVEQAVDADGRVLWLQSDKVPCFGADGSVIAVMVMKHDISERRAAQESLRVLNEDWKRACASAPPNWRWRGTKPKRRTARSPPSRPP